MDIVSKRTRNAFQEFLVTWTLRQIQKVFDEYNVPYKELPAEFLPSGQRRGLVEEYYSCIDWANQSQVKKVLDVYVEVLQHTDRKIRFDEDVIGFGQSAELKKQYEVLLNVLERDGFSYDGKSLRPKHGTNIELNHDAADLLDPYQFNEYVDRIKSSIEDDPALAIGSTKELVEAVLKTILVKLDGVDIDKDDDVPKLLRKAQKALKLAPDDIDNAAKGAEIVRVLLSNLGSVVIKLTELRNLYGTGHGAEKKRKGMEPRHAKLAVGAGITLSSFLLDTFKNRSTK